MLLMLGLYILTVRAGVLLALAMGALLVYRWRSRLSSSPAK